MDGAHAQRVATMTMWEERGEMASRQGHHCQRSSRFVRLRPTLSGTTARQSPQSSEEKQTDLQVGSLPLFGLGRSLLLESLVRLTVLPIAQRVQIQRGSQYSSHTLVRFALDEGGDTSDLAYLSDVGPSRRGRRGRCGGAVGLGRPIVLDAAIGSAILLRVCE